MRRLLALLIVLLLPPTQAQAQHVHTHPSVGNRAIEFPDPPGYQTLLCDFHTHTVFSDGRVWPNIRVQEAHRDGPDAVAITGPRLRRGGPVGTHRGAYSACLRRRAGRAVPAA